MDRPLDHLERARAGDLAGFEALVDLWGNTAYRLAWLLTGDHARSAAIVRRTFLNAWRELPALHSRRAFRPWLLSTVIEIAREDGFGAPPATLAPVAAAGERAHAAAALRHGVGLRLGEIAETMIESLRDVRASLGAAHELLGGRPEDELLHEVADDLRGIELEGGFFHTALRARLERTPAAVAARSIGARPPAVWHAACSAAGITSALDAGIAAPAGTRALAPGDHVRGTGRLAGKRARYDVLVTRVAPPSLITWTADARLWLRPGSVELRFSLGIERDGDDTRLTLALDGIALPELGGRGLDDLAERIRPSMHRGLESLAARAASL